MSIPTEFPVNHPSARKRWGKDLAVETLKSQYWSKFMGSGEDDIIKIQNELKNKAGDKITVELVRKLSGDGVEGDSTLEGSQAEEGLDFFHDAVFVDQRRKSTLNKGKMSDQRVPHDIRLKGRSALKTWWSEDYDEQIMMYLAGARGIDPSYKVALDWTGRAGNPLTPPDRLIYGGDASGKADLDASDIMHLSMLERLVAFAETTDPMIRPVKIQGEKKYILLVHTFQAYQLRTGTSENDWLEIQKATGERGKKNKVYRNALGEYADCIMHKHRNVVRFSDYGAGGDLPAARALFLGAHAGIIAWAKNGNINRMNWYEEEVDRGNALAIAASAIYGTKRTVYTDKEGANPIDYGVIAVDTYCKDPNTI